MKTVLIPSENHKDLKEIPDTIKQGLEIITVEKFEDALKYVFRKKAVKKN